MSRALFDAMKAHDVDRLASLLAAGEDPDPPFNADCSYTLLSDAIEGLHPVVKHENPYAIDEVILLLRYGADVNRWDKARTETPLIIAMRIPHAECARILLSAGADPNVKDEEGETPLRLFTKAEDFETVRLLLQCGADMYRWGGCDGMNSISLAATRLNVDLVRLFLAHGADPMVPDVDYNTVLDNMRNFPSYLKPETPENLERFRTIRRLLGGE